MEYKICKLCGSIASESHHIIHRSQLRALINCKLNQVYLCNNCHSYLHHNRNGCELDYALQLEFQNTLEMLFIGQSFDLEEIQETLNINYNATYGLSKLMRSNKGKYTREDIILACLGGEYPQTRYEKAKKNKKKR